VTHQAALTGAQEVPAVATMASGSASFRLNGDTLFYEINHNVAGGTAAHIHGGHGGVNGPVVFPLDPFGVDMTGQVTLTPDQITALNEGRFYVNIHSGANPGGEIRGQILPVDSALWVAPLSGVQQVPPVMAASSGAVAIILNGARDSITYQVTHTATQTAMHIHLGGAGTNGPVVYNLNREGGTQAVNAADVAALTAGRWYVNVHTAANPNGEIRGQIIRPGDTLLVANLTGAQEVPPVNTTASGSATLLLDYGRTQIRYYITTTATPAAAHIHFGNGGASGPVLAPFDPVSREMTGQITATSSLTTALLAGGAYVNIHTAANPNGELRGQILMPGEALYTAVLSGANEVPPLNNPGSSGSMGLIVSPDRSRFRYLGSASGFAATAAHIHGGAAGVEGPVVYTLTLVPAGATLSLLVGESPMTPADLTEIEAGRWYVNVHSAANPGGEIRDQLTRK
jgi:hypothetical protein